MGALQISEGFYLFRGGEDLPFVSTLTCGNLFPMAEDPSSLALVTSRSDGLQSRNEAFHSISRKISRYLIHSAHALPQSARLATLIQPAYSYKLS